MNHWCLHVYNMCKTVSSYDHRQYFEQKLNTAKGIALALHFSIKVITQT